MRERVSERAHVKSSSRHDSAHEGYMLDIFVRNLKLFYIYIFIETVKL